MPQTNECKIIPGKTMKEKSNGEGARVYHDKMVNRSQNLNLNHKTPAVNRQRGKHQDREQTDHKWELRA